MDDAVQCEEFQCKNGSLIKIALNDDDYTATALDPSGAEIGHFEFYEISDESGTVLKFSWAYLDKLDGSYKRQGIGEEMLRRVKDRYRHTIIAEANDGIRKDDGSHLTQDAVGFVQRMREKGLIAPLPGEDYD